MGGVASADERERAEATGGGESAGGAPTGDAPEPRAAGEATNLLPSKKPKEASGDAGGAESVLWVYVVFAAFGLLVLTMCALSLTICFVEGGDACQEGGSS